MDKLIEGLIWLGQGGREAAHELWEHRDALDSGVLDEAIEWLADIREGTEP